MKKHHSSFLALVACTAIGLFFVPMTTTQAQDAARSSESSAPFRHVVCFKFKDGTPAVEIAEIEKAFGALKSKIPTIVDFEWGTSESVEKLNDGFTHCFFVSFADKKGLEAYIPHPDHQAFVALIKPKLDKVFVFDYTAKK
jgi:hypothetical protein